MVLRHEQEGKGSLERGHRVMEEGGLCRVYAWHLVGVLGWDGKLWSKG